MKKEEKLKTYFRDSIQRFYDECCVGCGEIVDCEIDNYSIDFLTDCTVYDFFEKDIWNNILYENEWFEKKICNNISKYENLFSLEKKNIIDFYYYTSVEVLQNERKQKIKKLNQL